MYTDEDYEDKTEEERQRTLADRERTLPEMRGLPKYGQIVYGRVWPILNQVVAERAAQAAATPKVSNPPKIRPPPIQPLTPTFKVGVERPKVEVTDPLPPPPPDNDLVELYNLL